MGFGDSLHIFSYAFHKTPEITTYQFSLRLSETLLLKFVSPSFSMGQDVKHQNRRFVKQHARMVDIQQLFFSIN
jgi:hypothetical protein